MQNSGTLVSQALDTNPSDTGPGGGQGYYHRHSLQDCGSLRLRTLPCRLLKPKHCYTSVPKDPKSQDQDPESRNTSPSDQGPPRRRSRPQALCSRRKKIPQLQKATVQPLEPAVPISPQPLLSLHSSLPARARPRPLRSGRQLRRARPLHARPHPGRPVRVALHLGKHQVPGLEGVRHAFGGGPGRGKQQRRQWEAKLEAGVGRLRGGGVRTGRRPASTYWVRHGRKSRPPLAMGRRRRRS